MRNSTVSGTVLIFSIKEPLKIAFLREMSHDIMSLETSMRFLPHLRHSNPKMEYSYKPEAPDAFIHLTFTDETTHSIRVQNYASSHQLMSRLNDLDAEKVF